MKTSKTTIFALTLLAVLSARGQVEFCDECFEHNGVWYAINAVPWADIISRPDGKKYSGNLIISNPVHYKSYDFEVGDFIDSPLDDTPDLQSLTLPEKKEPWYLSIDNSGISEIIFPENDLTLNVFYATGCPNLKEIRFNSRNTKIGSGALRRESRKIIFEGNTVIEHKALPNNPDVVWGSGTHRIFDNGLTAFGVLYLELPEKILLEKHALGGTFKTLEIGKDLDTNGTLNNLDVNFVHFGAGIFSYCPYLEKLIIHNPVPRNVHPEAFKNLYHYRDPDPTQSYDINIIDVQQEFDFHDPNPEIDPDQFLKQVTLYVPAEAVETYRAHPQWGRFANIRAITDGVDDITADSDATAAPQWFNLQGQPVDSPRPGQLLLKRTGNRTRKVLIK